LQRDRQAVGKTLGGVIFLDLLSLVMESMRA